MRILVTSRGSTGHLTPLAPFAHAALHAGHEVLAVVQHAHAPNAKRLGLPYTTVDAAPPETWRPLMARFAQLDLEVANEAMVRDYFGRLDTEAALPGLRQVVRSWHPDVILRESWEYASTIVGEQEGIRVVRGGLALGAVEAMSDALLPPVLDPIRVAEGLAPDPHGHALRDTPHLTMLPDAVEDPTAAGPRCTYRFRHPARGGALGLPEDWWPGLQELPLVYVSFGSVTGGQGMPYFPALYREVVRRLGELPCRVLLTLGLDPDTELLGPVPANVHVEPWVPQDAVLARAAAAVIHGGHGSTLGALAHGVPTVVLPLFSLDQWANAAAIERTGAGIALDGDRATRKVLGMPRADVLDDLAPAVEHVLADPAYRLSAERIAASIAALPGPDAAVDVLLGAAVAVA
jgi:UDP-N-acetylglucosamine:LPS N-acetylglucosamine transferase